MLGTDVHSRRLITDEQYILPLLLPVDVHVALMIAVFNFCKKVSSIAGCASQADSESQVIKQFRPL